ncbi:hypothetical protein J7E70_26840 [Variovorax paradoxus]|nr:YciI family protein [Variovorax paradoxus]MBT2304059.1 hypothetical protein [Variovorax paradoxus]
MPSAAAQLLLQSMLNKQLYVVFRTARDLKLLDELLESHLQWAVAAEQRGELFASGPFVARDAAPGSAGGMSILRAGSEEEARAIVSADPFVGGGAVDVEVREWQLMEGSFTMTIRLSNQTSRLS